VRRAQELLLGLPHRFNFVDPVFPLVLELAEVDWDVRPMLHIEVRAPLQVVADLARAPLIVLLDPREDALRQPHVDGVRCLRKVP